MERNCDPINVSSGAVFQSKRRSAFSAPSDRLPIRGANTRTAPRPKTKSTNRPVSKPRRLGLEGNWSEVAEILASCQGKTAVLELGCGESHRTLVARAFSHSDIAVLAADGDFGQVEENSKKIILDKELFKLLENRKAAVAIRLGEKPTARLVSFESVESLFSPTIVSPADRSEEAATTGIERAESGKGTVAANDKEPKQRKASNRVRTSPISQINTESSVASGKKSSPRLKAVTPPRGFPETLLDLLAETVKKAKIGEMAATLIRVEYVDGQSEYVIGFVGAPLLQHDILEEGVGKALASYTRSDVNLGIAFFDDDDKMANRIVRIGTALI